MSTPTPFYIPITGSTGLIYTTTGSAGMLVPILFIDGETASKQYGIPVRVYNGPCIYCKLPLSQPLALNPFDGHFYLNCCGCQKWFRWLNPDGVTLSDLQEVQPYADKPQDAEDWMQDFPWF